MTTWTDERTQRMLQLLAEGLTGNQVANLLGGVSRNAVIGKAHRLGKSIRVLRNTSNEPSKKRALRVRKRLNIFYLESVRKRPTLRYKPMRDPTAIPRVRKPKKPAGSCTILELNRHTCHWPLWQKDDDPRLYCGVKTDGKVYCKEHRILAKRFGNNAHEYVRRDPERDFVINRRPAKSPKSIVV